MADTWPGGSGQAKEHPMPWRELSVSAQREEFVRLAMMPGANRSALCRRFGVSRDVGYKWLRRYAAEGASGLEDRSRRPHASPERTPAAIAAEVLRVRAGSNGAWGGRKIAAAMRRAGMRAVPAPSTITEILRRHGQLEARSQEYPGPWRRFERVAPNELWQMDFKGHFALPQGRCHPLTVLDDHSRYALGLEAMGDEQEPSVRARLIAIFRRYGLPFAMIMDNGSPWGENGGGRYTVFTVWLIRLGIQVSHARPFHPQTCGKDERFHRSLKAELLAGNSFRDLAHCQRAFDDWRLVYNHQRPHEALAMGVPAERYRMSPRPFPDTLPPIEYAPGDLVRRVQEGGRISFKNRIWRVGKAFVGQPIALRPTQHDGHFTLHFCTQRIGAIDLRPSACGFVDSAQVALPTTPQAPPPPQKDQKMQLKG
jgi:transposase InsO family protein